MYLITGLGNPGPKYVNTPHNAGWWGLDFLAIKLGVVLPDWTYKFESLLTQTTHKNKKLILLKPFTQMNLSGGAVQEVAAYYKITPEHIWIFHDDLDLKIGEFKLTQKRPRTHKGLDSIDKYLGDTAGLHFARIGIMPEQKPQNPKQYVLTPLPKEPRQQIKKAAQAAAEQLLELI